MELLIPDSGEPRPILHIVLTFMVGHAVRHDSVASFTSGGYLN